MSEALEGIVGSYFQDQKTYVSKDLELLLPPAFFHAFEQIMKDKKYEKGWKAFQRDLSWAMKRQLSVLIEGNSEILEQLQAMHEGRIELPDIAKEFNAQTNKMVTALIEDGERTRLKIDSYQDLGLERFDSIISALQTLTAQNNDLIEKNRENTDKIINEIQAIKLGGRVQVLTDDLLSYPANSNRVKQFYGGAKLGWDILAANGDIPRDQQKSLVDELKVPSNEIRFVCVVAEPGAGKSTFAWRVAYELHQEHRALVVHIKDNENADVWYALPEFCSKVDRPIYVLVDDIFRDADALFAFGELNPWLPITVLATSRINEYRGTHRLKFAKNRLDLKFPSFKEKKYILKKFGKSRTSLTPEQRIRFDNANQFLVLMMELYSGKELREIVRDSIKRLRDLEMQHYHNDSAYRAYEYLSFTYQYSITMPYSLLERLDNYDNFHNLPNRDTTQGLIFWDDRAGHVRVGHPIIAEESMRFYAEHHSPKTVINTIITAVDPDNYIHRIFLVHLLRTLAQKKSPFLDLLSDSSKNEISICVKNLSRIFEASLWRAFYLFRKNHEKAEKCLDHLLGLEPVSSFECSLLLKFARERGTERDAIPTIAKYVKGNPKDQLGRVVYLKLIERNTTAETDLALRETATWVADNPGASFVRVAYLGFVERKGTIEQVNQALEQTNGWLKDNPNVPNVRVAYLGFVERNGTNEQVNQALEQTNGWLKDNPNVPNVRVAYLGFVERKGTIEQVNQALEQTSGWLKDNPDVPNVRVAYLGFVERKGTIEQVNQALEQTNGWLKDNPDESNVRQAYLNLIAEHGSAEHKESIINITKAWLLKNPWAQGIWDALMSWLFRIGRNDEAIELGMEAIALYPNNVNIINHYSRAVREHADDDTVRGAYKLLFEKNPKHGSRTHYAAWLRDSGYYEEAEKYYQMLIKENPRWHASYYGYGVLLQNLERFDEAADQFRRVLQRHKGHQLAHNQLAWALWKSGDFTNAEREFRSAIYWAGVHQKPQAKLFTDLGWFFLDQKCFNDALFAFTSAKEEDPDYYGNYWGIGCTLKGLCDYIGASDALRIALEKEPNLEPPASEEIPQLLKQCLQLL